MEKEIIDYLLKYIFQRIAKPNTYNYNHNSQVLTLENIQLTIPSIKRKKNKKVEILNHSVSFYRYNDKIALEESGQNHLKLSFDLIGEVYDHLTLARENDHDFDPAAMEVLLPVLDMKIYYFFELLKPHLEIKFRDFQGKAFALCLTHDIDRTGDSWRYRVITHFFQALKQKRPSLIFHGIFGKNREANFRSIIEKEHNYDAQATWFYLTRYGLRNNADYHLNDKIAQESVKLIKEANHEIGLHIPFMEMTKENVLEEKKKIPVSDKMGVRIHHLRGEYTETLPLFAECDLLYDSTYGFNWNMAYRFGTSIPFHPIIDKKILSIFEFPMNIMDLHVGSIEDFQAKIRLLFHILNKVHGVCVIIWHNNRFNKFKRGYVNRLCISKEFEIESL